jgi:hypothetical protein
MLSARARRCNRGGALLHIQIIDCVTKPTRACLRTGAPITARAIGGDRFGNTHLTSGQSSVASDEIGLAFPNKKLRQPNAPLMRQQRDKNQKRDRDPQQPE